MAFLLQHLIRESASRHPEQIALIHQGQVITYSDLEAQSNVFSNLLLSLPSAKYERIGIYLNRGIDSIVAAIGALKAGAIYVPIDPQSPVRRLQFIIGHCEIRTILTTQNRISNLEESFSEGSPLKNVVVMDAAEALPPSRVAPNLVAWKQASMGFDAREQAVSTIDGDPAYILFTSGSTGSPKGVTLSHLNALTFIESAFNFFQITKDDRLSNICPLHFDMSVFDIYVAIKAAATTVIVPETSAIFPAKVAEIISTQKISVWNSVPSAISMLATLSNLAKYDFSRLRLVLFAGEVFPLKYLRRLKPLIQNARFCNMYGQTEANSSTYHWVDELPPNDNATLPIGSALPNFEVFAIDNDGHLVSEPGQEGELYVRASTVSLGYWADPERTAKAFVANPLAPESRERLYKTGDLVRLNPDGEFVFLNRKDFMIKSRGYRIEIGEIESVLCNHPGIKAAVVIPIPDELIGNRISAIIEPLPSVQMDRDDILNYCAKQLPKYMVPEIIQFRNSLPITSSGKIDRQQLRAL
jgi:amino acid adenylation domain-containing protein